MRILVIRKDNIGDLVCTTPLFARLRAHWPEARISALVTRYNLPVLTGNPHLDTVYSYQKAKHRGPDESWLGIYAQRATLFLTLRRLRFDWILLPGGPHPSALRAAQLLNPGQVIVRTQTPPGAHEVECVLQVARPLGITETAPPPPTRVLPDPRAQTLLSPLPRDGRRRIGLHISARKPAQRWPAERCIDLIRQLHARGERVLLFWSPGAANNPLHPGDDDKAGQILHAVGDLAVTPMPTQALPELIEGLALCQGVICSDGGAMHLAAGLGKPIVCFFGNSDAQRWHPWGPPYRLLQPASQRVDDIATQEVLAAFDGLMNP
ncbi:MAG: glycosyltransferase family 9 protein [Magnetococcales bacterium]|nr:glycosyltransferase family 9 protein [Magnetococcales bacterium]